MSDNAEYPKICMHARELKNGSSTTNVQGRTITVLQCFVAVRQEKLEILWVVRQTNGMLRHEYYYDGSVGNFHQFKGSGKLPYC